MNEIIREYGTMIIGATATLIFLGLVGGILLGQGGLFYQLMLLWGNGGC